MPFSIRRISTFKYILFTPFLNIESHMAQCTLPSRHNFDKQTTGANAASKMERGLDVLRAHFSYATELLAVGFSQQHLMMVLSSCFHFQDLIKDLHSELSGDFRKLVMATLKTPAEFDASELYSAIKVNAQEQIFSLFSIILSTKNDL